MRFFLDVWWLALHTNANKMDDVIVVSVYGLHWNLREERNIRKFSYLHILKTSILHQVKAPTLAKNNKESRFLKYVHKTLKFK